MDNPIFVVGAPRSGTSLVAGIVDACGAFGGRYRPANESNPRGYFENARIVDEIVKPILVAAGGDRNGQKSLPTTKSVEPSGASPYSGFDESGGYIVHAPAKAPPVTKNDASSTTTESRKN